MASINLPNAVIDGARTVSAEELTNDVARTAAGLHARGVHAGDRVIVSLPNSYAFVVIHFALDLLGAITVNLPTALRREVGQVVRMVDAHLSIFEQVDDARHYGDIRAYVSLGDGGIAQLAGDPATLPDAGHSPDGKSWLAFTSGSTGTPRAAVHTRGSLEATTRGMAERYALGTSDTILASAPVGHAIGFCYGVRLAAQCGGRLVLQTRWDAAEAVALIDREQCSFAAIPTPFLADLLDLDEHPAGGSLRHLLVGGAPVARDQVSEADRVFGVGVTSGYYGASECGAVLSSPPGATDEQRLTTDGTPMPGLEIRIVDEQGEDVACGQPGEMLVRGDQVALGYWANNDSDEQFRPDGWFATRDRVVAGADGFASVTGRMKDVIFRGAVNVTPREVEEAVAGHPGVGYAVVLGTPDRRLGERIVAVVTSDDPAPTLEDVRQWLSNVGLARSKWPDELHVVGELPRTASGKIDRGRIRDELHVSERSA
jgi:acyl-CoA synthetase (AMP-forming)/AMP-acid ligase II